MNYTEAIQFLYGLRWFGAKFGLDNTRKLAALAGDPQDQLRFIHVAGTNGKGSTCAMLESIYRAAGLRVGLFTSPHLVSFRERIQVNRQLVNEADVVRLVAETERGCPSRSTSDANERSIISMSADEAKRCGWDSRAPGHGQDAGPTFFEFITVMALRYFAEQKCDLVIWETGLGGRLDATNIVTPLVSVITNIGLDHQQWLGDTPAKIATEKAGIIKPGVPVVTATDDPEALRVIEATAQRLASPLRHISTHPPSLRFAAASHASLHGEHQKLNASLAVAVVEVLRDRIPVSDEQIGAGLAQVHWPGRLQLVVRPDGRRLLLDGAHNVAGAEALRAALRGGAPSTLIIGILSDKDWQAMCHILAPLAARILLVPVDNERTTRPEALADICRAANPQADVVCCASLSKALSQVERAPFVVIAGSLYLIGEAMELLELSPVPSADEKALNNWQPRSAKQ